MKKLVFLCLLGLAVVIAGEARAQFMLGGGDFATPEGATTSAPSVISAEQVALLYYRMAGGQWPDFKGMAKQSDEYKAASDFEKEKIMEAKARSLRNNFDLTSPEDKVIVKLPVTLSPFSVRNKGYVIKELGDTNLAFKFEYCGRNYAFIPQAMNELQWIDASDEKLAIEIDKARGKEDAYALYITFAPTYADPTDRLTELDDGKQYSILTGTTVSLALYDAGGKTFLWTNRRAEVTEAVNENLLKLKQ